MPRYFFDITDDQDHIDEVGVDVADHRSLTAEAQRILLVHCLRAGGDRESYALVLQVRDERGDKLKTIRMACQIESHNPELDNLMAINSMT